MTRSYRCAVNFFRRSVAKKATTTGTAQNSLENHVRLPEYPTRVATNLSRLYSSSAGVVYTENSSKSSESDAAVPRNNLSIFEEIAQGDADMQRRLKVLEFEVAILQERYVKIPSSLEKKHWLELLQLTSWSSRKRYLEYIFKIEKRKENENFNRQKRVEKNQEVWAKQSEDYHIDYGLSQNTMFLRIYNQSLNKLLNPRLLAASMYSQHVVFDCSYGEYMSPVNTKYCASQIAQSFSANRLHPAPFHLKFCNVEPSFRDQLEHNFQASLDSLFIDAVSESYLDMYPKQRLVYLSPHAKECLTSWNPNDIYIIGAYVDKGNGRKVSLAKAKDSKIRMVKFPIDYYLNWQKGGKSLPLNTVLNIMLDLRFYKSWEKAFENIASRCLLKDTAKSMRNNADKK